MSANRVSRSRSGLNDGAAEPLRSLSTCMRVPSQPMHMHCCYPSLQRAAALYYLSTMRAEPFFPASSIHFLSHFASDPQLRLSLFLHLLSVILPESSEKRERKRASLRENRSLGTACSSFSFFLHFDQVTRELIRTSPPVRKSGEGVGHDNEQSSGWSG